LDYNREYRQYDYKRIPPQFVQNLFEERFGFPQEGQYIFSFVVINVDTFLLSLYPLRRNTIV